MLGIYSWAWVLALSVVCILSETALDETNVFICKQLSIGNSFWENSRETCLLNSTAEAHGELTEAVATYTEVEQVWACWGPSSLNHKP